MKGKTKIFIFINQNQNSQNKFARELKQYVTVS